MKQAQQLARSQRSLHEQVRELVERRAQLEVLARDLAQTLAGFQPSMRTVVTRIGEVSDRAKLDALLDRARLLGVIV